MKRYNNLFDQIISFENILRATQKARKGKRYKASTAYFEYNLEENIFNIINQLKSKTYKPGSYNDFYIYDPKKRMISAAPYRDRVVHHALINVIEPLFARSFIYDSYACLTGKGTHKAVARYKEYVIKNRYVLKCDITKYFQNVDHEILFRKLSDKIKCKDTLWLCSKIIDSKNCDDYYAHFPGDDLLTPLSRKKGIPIGNLTSQFFSNVYLNDFDHFVKETLKAEYYIRYCDDFVVLENRKDELNYMKAAIATWLEPLRLRLHPAKSRIYRADDGVDFLGYRIFPGYSLVRKSIVKKYRKKVCLMESQLKKNSTLPVKIVSTVESWIGHIKHANSYTLIKELFLNLYILLKQKGIESNNLARRFVEQRQ